MKGEKKLMQALVRVILGLALFLELDSVSWSILSPAKPVILFDETRLHKRSAGSYKEGAGYGYAISETAWYGASVFARLLRERGYEVRAIKDRPINASTLAEANVLLILEPNIKSPYDSLEIQAVREFVRKGGGLFLACRTWRGSREPSGGADALARAFWVSFKDNGKIRDPTDHFGDNLDIVEISSLEDHSITDGVKAYYFQGTYLDRLGGAKAVAFSDGDSWFDRFGPNDWGDDERQSSEESGPFPVLAVMEYGEGRIVFAGDATIMMNDWIDDLDAERLALNIVEWLLRIQRKPPIADFTFSPGKPSILDIVKFIDRSTDPDGTIVSWKWEFGDGTSSIERNPTHRYSEKKTFTVKLTVTDNDGLTATVSRKITVVNLPPKAGFTHSPSQPIVDHSVIFDASASSDPDGTIIKYEWDFGDGSTGEGEVVHHTFTKAGIYKVKLTVTDDDGASASTEQEVKVLESGGGGGPA